ncbi:MAG: recombinase RecT [Thermoguttaceae bacterium]|nr:recombinase RecT [Thermoguttaceae bacterium]
MKEIQIRNDNDAEIVPNGSGSKFGSMLALANRLAASKLVPAQFRGAPEDIYLALDMADRLDMNPLMVMQNLYIVQGKPAWSSQFIIACVNASRRYTPLRFVTERDKAGSIVSCRCVANDRMTGEVLTGTTITAEMVKSEGWDTKAGSKWKTMPEQMYRYRAAAFFARANCPELTMGIYSADEVREISEQEEPAPAPEVKKLATIAPDYEPDFKVSRYAQRMRSAAEAKELQAVESEIGLDDKLTGQDKDFLRPISASKRKELSM